MPLPKTWQAEDLAALPGHSVTLYIEGIVVSDAARDVELRLVYTGPDGPCEDRVKLTVFKLNLTFANGGSDLDGGESTGSLGPEVAEDDEETVGGFILVNWDDDDGDGALRPGRVPERLATGHGHPELLELLGRLGRVDPCRPPRRPIDRPIGQ